MSPNPSTTTALTFTGERFTPEHKGPIWYEHWHRYCAVAPLARGRRVLDAACGEGYGAALLATEAAEVVGVDVGADAIAHARPRYAVPNLFFVQASVAELPLAARSSTSIVSFETIEHLAAQREMLAEFRRVLADDGVLVISSPNRPVYNELGDVENEFHVRELDRDELKLLLDARLPRAGVVRAAHPRAFGAVGGAAVRAETCGSTRCRARGSRAAPRPRRRCISWSSAPRAASRCLRCLRSRCSTTGNCRCGVTSRARCGASASSRGTRSTHARSPRID